jgi:hypothetical protein
MDALDYCLEGLDYRNSTDATKFDIDYSPAIKPSLVKRLGRLSKYDIDYSPNIKPSEAKRLGYLTKK